MKKLLRNSLVLILLQAICACIAFYSFGFYALTALGGGGAISVILLISAWVFGILAVLLVLHSIIFTIREMRRTKRTTISRALLLIFSCTMIIFPLYRFYYVPHQDVQKILAERSGEIALKKELAEQFKNPQNIASVQKNFPINDSQSTRPIPTPVSYAPLFTLDDGRKVVAVDLIQFGCRAGDKVDADGNAVFVSSNDLGTYAETLVGKSATFSVDTWQGFPNFQVLRLFQNYQKDKTQPVPVHMSVEEKLVGCESAKAYLGIK